MTRSGLSFTCVLLSQPKGCTALCVELDVASEGASPAQAKKQLEEAVELYLDAAVESNLPYLRPVPRDQDPRFTAPDSVLETFSLHANLAVQVRA